MDKNNIVLGYFRVRRLHSEEGGTTIIFNGVIKNDEETPAG